MFFFRTKQTVVPVAKSAAELQKMTELLETILDHTHFLVAYLDRDFNFIRVNRAYAEADQKEPAFFPGKNHFTVYPHAENEAIFKKVIETGEPYRAYAKPLTYADHPEWGVTYWDWSLAPIKHDHDVTSLILILSNVTEHVQAEQALAKTRDHLKKAQQVAHIGSWDLDLTKNELMWTDELYRMFGIPLETPLTYEMFLNAVHPDDREYVDTKWNAALRGEPYDIEHRVVVNGEICWVRERAQVDFDANGEAVRGIGTTQDITERKMTEKKMEEHDEEIKRINKYLTEGKNELEKEKAKDEALLNSIGEGMVATNKTGTIIAVNRAAETILGWSVDELVEKNMADIIPALNEYGVAIPKEERVMSDAITAKAPTVIKKMYYLRKNGERVPVAVTISPVLLDGELIGAIEIFRDITSEEKLEKTRQDLLSLASHQLRTPLSGTKWLIETLNKGLHGPLTEKQREYLDEIYRINERMTQLVFDMLNVLRIESGIIPPRVVSIPIKDLLKTTLKHADAPAKSRRITLKTSGATESTVTTDPDILQNILENFLGNAINYSIPGNDVTIHVEKITGETVFHVKDSGIGIPKDEQTQIFERFFRASNAKTFNTRGTGLGLYIATTLAHRIGATLSFESEEGRGSTFSIHIPSSNTQRS